MPSFMYQDDDEVVEGDYDEKNVMHVKQADIESNPVKEGTNALYVRVSENERRWIVTRISFTNRSYPVILVKEASNHNLRFALSVATSDRILEFMDDLVAGDNDVEIQES